MIVNMPHLNFETSPSTISCNISTRTRTFPVLRTSATGGSARPVRVVGSFASVSFHSGLFNPSKDATQMPSCNVVFYIYLLTSTKNHPTCRFLPAKNTHIQDLSKLQMAGHNGVAAPCTARAAKKNCAMSDALHGHNAEPKRCDPMARSER